MSATIAETLPSVPEKSAKYDRQLRLWAANGQAALESARIALFGATATGCEALKNLVLPGIGSFTVIDDATVAEADCGTNFFVSLDRVGEPRAQVTCEYLQELNGDVQGNAWAECAATIIGNDIDRILDNFDLVIVSDLKTESLRALADALWQRNIHLVVAQTNGFIGYIRLAIPEHTIVETHPGAIVDLRLDRPWPELARLIDGLDLAGMNDNEHTHVPYIVLLLYFLQRWRTEHDGATPKTGDEKAAFKASIRAEMRNADEDNFDEAIANVWRACSLTHVPSDVRRVFDDPACRNLTVSSTDFWFLARAVADFVADSEGGDGLLPLAGVLPDMKADTNTYVTLQRLYRARARRDIDVVKQHLQRHLAAVGKAADAISDDQIDSFCKHAAYIKVIRYRALAEELSAPKASLAAQLGDEGSHAAWYLAFRAAEQIYSERVEHPGAAWDSDLAAERTQLVQRARSLLPTSQSTSLSDAGQTALDDACAEIVRSGGGELHTIAALVGGVAAQECIKLLTKQYVPVNNTWLFDGVHSTSEVFEM